jgi:hypothetical protein
MRRLVSTLLDRVRRRGREEVSRVLDVGYHNGRRVEVELLHGVVGAESEQAGARTPDGNAADVFQRGDAITGDMLGPYIMG